MAVRVVWTGGGVDSVRVLSGGESRQRGDGMVGDDTIRAVRVVRAASGVDAGRVPVDRQTYLGRVPGRLSDREGGSDLPRGGIGGRVAEDSVSVGSVIVGAGRIGGSGVVCRVSVLAVGGEQCVVAVRVVRTEARVHAGRVLGSLAVGGGHDDSEQELKNRAIRDRSSDLGTPEDLTTFAIIFVSR